MYDASLALHVIAAVVGFGATFSYPVIQLAADRRASERSRSRRLAAPRCAARRW